MLNSIIDIEITESGSEPVTLADAKTQCLVDHSLDDTFITSLITQCRQEIENACGISIIDKDIVLTADWRKAQRLPNGPVQSLASVQFQVTDFDDFETVDSGDYKLSGSVFASRKCGRHKISYSVGMDTVDVKLKNVILNLIAFRYENRGDHEIDLSDDLKRQISIYKDYSWA